AHRMPFVEVHGGHLEPPADEHRFADPEALTDEMMERQAKRRQIAAMFSRRNFDLLARKRRIAAGEGVEHFHFDERDLAHIGFGRVGADSVEISIAFDPAPSDKLGFVKLLHLGRCSFGDMNMEEAAGPDHRVSRGLRLVRGTNVSSVLKGRAYSAACRDGERTLSSPSAAVAEIVVRTMSRASCAGHGRPRCMVARLSHMTTSPLRQLWT